MIEILIVKNEEKIGYAEIFEFDDFTYVKSIEISVSHRNNGYGTEVLKTLASENDIYICPDNADAERLYARLGDEVSKAPEEIESELDEYGVMYKI